MASREAHDNVALDVLPRDPSLILDDIRVESGAATRSLRIPAIAVPLATKDSFECPADHVEMLRRLLPGVDRLLLIGWRASEAQFVEMLKSLLPREVSIDVVSRVREGALETVANLAGVTARRVGILEGGFSRLISMSAMEGSLVDSTEFEEIAAHAA
jgi:hypothetical protein